MGFVRPQRPNPVYLKTHNEVTNCQSIDGFIIVPRHKPFKVILVDERPVIASIELHVLRFDGQPYVPVGGSAKRPNQPQQMRTNNQSPYGVNVCSRDYNSSSYTLEVHLGGMQYECSNTLLRLDFEVFFHSHESSPEVIVFPHWIAVHSHGGIESRALSWASACLLLLGFDQPISPPSSYTPSIGAGNKKQKDSSPRRINQNNNISNIHTPSTSNHSSSSSSFLKLLPLSNFLPSWLTSWHSSSGSSSSSTPGKSDSMSKISPSVPATFRALTATACLLCIWQWINFREPDEQRTPFLIFLPESMPTSNQTQPFVQLEWEILVSMQQEELLATLIGPESLLFSSPNCHRGYLSTTSSNSSFSTASLAHTRSQFYQNAVISETRFKAFTKNTLIALAQARNKRYRELHRLSNIIENIFHCPNTDVESDENQECIASSSSSSFKFSHSSQRLISLFSTPKEASSLRTTVWFIGKERVEQFLLSRHRPGEFLLRFSKTSSTHNSLAHSLGQPPPSSPARQSGSPIVPPIPTIRKKTRSNPTAGKRRTSSASLSSSSSSSSTTAALQNDQSLIVSVLVRHSVPQSLGSTAASSSSSSSPVCHCCCCGTIRGLYRWEVVHYDLGSVYPDDKSLQKSNIIEELVRPFQLHDDGPSSQQHHHQQCGFKDTPDRRSIDSKPLWKQQLEEWNLCPLQIQGGWDYWLSLPPFPPPEYIQEHPVDKKSPASSTNSSSVSDVDLPYSFSSHSSSSSPPATGPSYSTLSDRENPISNSYLPFTLEEDQVTRVIYPPSSSYFLQMLQDPNIDVPLYPVSSIYDDSHQDRNNTMDDAEDSSDLCYYSFSNCEEDSYFRGSNYSASSSASSSLFLNTVTTNSTDMDTTFNNGYTTEDNQVVDWFSCSDIDSAPSSLSTSSTSLLYSNPSAYFDFDFSTPVGMDSHVSGQLSTSFQTPPYHPSHYSTTETETETEMEMEGVVDNFEFFDEEEEEEEEWVRRFVQDQQRQPIEDSGGELEEKKRRALRLIHRLLHQGRVGKDTHDLFLDFLNAQYLRDEYFDFMVFHRLLYVSSHTGTSSSLCNESLDVLETDEEDAEQINVWYHLCVCQPALQPPST